MIDSTLFLAFVLTVAVLMVIPGPNVALIVANSVAHGTRYGLLTVAGTSSAMVVQLSLAAMGMAGLLGELGAWFEVVRWIGVAYLLYLAVRMWRTPLAGSPVDLGTAETRRTSAVSIYVRALLVSLTNPKTLLFYGAFFPQFLNPNGNLGAQIGLLSATFLLLAIAIDGCWALAAGRARSLLNSHARLPNRIGAVLLAGAGIGLAAARNH